MKAVFLITAITGIALTTGCSVMSEAFNEGVNQADYTETMKAAYTKSCVTEAEKNVTPDEARKYCECTFERISSTVPVGEFVKLDNSEAVKEETTTAFKVAITQCGGKAPSEVQSSDNQTSPHWGAWAIDTGGGNYFGWAWNSSTEEEAKQGALDSCSQQGAVNCEVLNSFQTGYAAMASGESKWFGVGARASAEEARNEALKGCRNAEKNPNTCTIDKEFNF